MSSLVSKNINIAGKRTSLRLEPVMWQALKEAATREGCGVNDLLTLIATHKKPDASFSATVRTFLVIYYKDAATETGHKNAGHRHKKEEDLLPPSVKRFPRTVVKKAIPR